ncbi:MAG: hypothetical protein MHM6MM_006485 [Cercozoa sp. M6MM]
MSRRRDSQSSLARLASPPPKRRRKQEDTASTGSGNGRHRLRVAVRTDRDSSSDTVDRHRRNSKSRHRSASVKEEEMPALEPDSPAKRKVPQQASTRRVSFASSPRILGEQSSRPSSSASATGEGNMWSILLPSMVSFTREVASNRSLPATLRAEAARRLHSVSALRQKRDVARTELSKSVARQRSVQERLQALRNDATASQLLRCRQREQQQLRQVDTLRRQLEEAEVALTQMQKETQDAMEAHNAADAEKQRLRRQQAALATEVTAAKHTIEESSRQAVEQLRHFMNKATSASSHANGAEDHETTTSTPN